jgi:hypothetical protein
MNVKKVGTSRIFKSRVFQVLRVDGKNELWYDDSLFVGWLILNVLQSRLRNRCSALHSDLYRANLIPNALCSCGKSDETASRTVNNINIRTHYHTVVNLLWNDLCLEWIFELVRTFFFRRWEFHCQIIK